MSTRKRLPRAGLASPDPAVPHDARQKILRRVVDAVLGGNVAKNHFPNQPGEFQFRCEGENSANVKIIFGCPRRAGSSCSVPVKGEALPTGAGPWGWDGNFEAPTITPSINCVGGCGWHGFITAGKVVNA
jgi:hypothetical protein